MSTKTDEFLNLLLWFADRLSRPTFRNLTDSYESWSFHSAMPRRIPEWKQKQLVEVSGSRPYERLYRLTARGRLRALGGRDPVLRWSRKWDGLWRIVLFDIPMTQNPQRRRLRRYLRSRWFGRLQDSVWITPDPLEEEEEILLGTKVDATMLVLLEGQPCASESDADIVHAAWDFDRINKRYLRLMRVLDEKPTGRVKSKSSALAMLRWVRAEHEAWLRAVNEDPLLPERLLPAGYLGKIAWERRLEVLRRARVEVEG